MEHLRCPQCLGAMDIRPAELSCTSCGRKYPVDLGVPILAENTDFYYCPAPRTWLSGLLRKRYREALDDPGGFERLLQEIVDHISDNARKPNWIENLVDESRAVAKFLTAMKPEHRVLNFGCGWDNTTINLARTARRVTAIDLTRPRIQLLSLKKRYYGLENIDLLCGGDTPHLPFADDSFDTVFINGVLEWVAADWSGENERCRGWGRPARLLSYLKAIHTRHRPAVIQQQFLGEIRRVLKQDGEVYIGIENRFSREYFSGRPDHHSYIRFGSLYPRPLAHLVSLYKKHRPYLTYTYGLGGYRSLLSRAGLPLDRCWSMEPDYRRPKQLVDLSAPAAIRRFTRGGSRRIRVMPAWLYRRSVPSFGLIGTAGQGTPPWIERVVADFGSRLESPTAPLQLRGLTCNRKGKVTLAVAEGDYDEARWLVKVPVSPLAATNCENHFRALHLIRTLAGSEPDLSPLLALLPQPVHQGMVDNQAYFAETVCRGRPWSESDGHDGQALWGGLGRGFELLGRIPLDPLPPEEEIERYREKTDRLRTLPGVDQPLHQRVLDQLQELFCAAVLERAGAAFLRKGDFSLSNVMISRGEISGLIDFDEWGASSDSLVDCADFTLSWLRHRKKIFWVQGLEQIHRLGDSGGIDGLPLEALCASRGAVAGDLAHSSLIAWLDHVDHACRHPHIRLNRRWVGRVVVNVLQALDGLLRDREK